MSGMQRGESEVGPAVAEPEPRLPSSVVRQNSPLIFCDRTFFLGAAILQQPQLQYRQHAQIQAPKDRAPHQDG